MTHPHMCIYVRLLDVVRTYVTQRYASHREYIVVPTAIQRVGEATHAEESSRANAAGPGDTYDGGLAG
jgi:hypothetical protein